MPPVFPGHIKSAPALTVRQEQRDRMDMQQILFFGLLLVPVWTCKMHRCYDEHELSIAAEKKLGRYQRSPGLSPAPAPDSPKSCRVELYRHQPQESIRDRSLSPWRLINVTKMDHYPSLYAEAECLCSGCIVFENQTPVESYNYNSVPITQSKIFLKRELCDDGKKYHLKPVSVDVVVGCTCVRAKTSSS